MNEIYSGAHKTLAYLGASADGSDLAMTSIAQINSKLQRVNGVTLTSMLHSLGLEARDHPVWRALDDLFQRQWFKRLWTLQEAVLVKELVVGCGSIWLDWETLSQLACAIIDHRIDYLVHQDMARGTPREECRDSTGCLYGTSQIRKMRQTFNAATGIALTELLILARQRMCKEPIDRIWAVLCLFHPQLREAILSIGCIDYSPIGKAQFWRSYIDLAKWVIVRDKTLAWLSIAASEKPPEIPSWCPNWAATETYPYFASINFYSSGYDSLTPRQSRVLLVPNSDKIQVPGSRIDKVKKVIDIYNGFLAADASELANQSEIFLEWESRCLKFVAGNVLYARRHSGRALANSYWRHH